jgi:hypothetical protein
MMTMSSKIMSEIKEKFYAFYYTDKLKLKVPLKKPGTVACAVILATGMVDIGCLRW